MVADDSSAGGSWRDAFVARQRNVIGHYREVLSRPMPLIEREALQRRIANIESEILVQQAMRADPTADEAIAA